MIIGRRHSIFVSMTELFKSIIKAG